MTYGFNRESRFLVDPDGVLDLIDNLSARWDPYNAEVIERRFESIMKSCFIKPDSKLWSVFRKLKINPIKLRKWIITDNQEIETTVALLNVTKVKNFKPKTFELIKN